MRNDVTVLDNFHTGNMDNLVDVKDEIKVIDDSCGNIIHRLSDLGGPFV